ncbi:carbohydrate kinase family protein [Persicimonas caeni]|nr:PfkB family carbohydrate kinase [Persicimonas caeni]
MRVLSVGSCTLDHLGVVERFAEPNLKAEMSKFSVQGGGCAATAIAALARWGVETKFIGKVGNDPRGKLIESTLADEGVDTSDMIHEEGAISQFRFVLIESGSGRKQTVYTRGSVSGLEPDEIDVSVLDDVDLLLVDGKQKAAQLELMREAKKRGITVMFEANRSQRDAAELVANADCLVASERFASQFAGVGRLESLCRALLDRGPCRVIVTMGDEGVVGMDADAQEMIRQEAHPVDVVDTTGAGDIFLGALAYGLLHEWDFAHMIEFANKAAALSCTDIGGRSAIFSIAEIQES